ncbi:perilipin-2-like [Dunckerocampus dactyliophorus]|uniref:perilipin-2-like n=1 Tax=Dunckerocampus dactyliophorus TaxID=161453 RepID=UPI002406F537|nr:perilipin-2-like [Dunckerocampus dactyliophorus]
MYFISRLADCVGLLSWDQFFAAMVEFQGTSHQNVVKRVGHLPVLSSTYGLVSSVYSITKGIHPYIGSVCEAAEVGVWSVTSVALETASPIICKLEPQIAMANDLACKGLDKIEQSLPLLQRPFEQVTRFMSTKSILINL